MTPLLCVYQAFLPDLSRTWVGNCIIEVERYPLPRSEVTTLTDEVSQYVARESGLAAVRATIINLIPLGDD